MWQAIGAVFFLLFVLGAGTAIILILSMLIQDEVKCFHTKLWYDQNMKGRDNG